MEINIDQILQEANTSYNQGKHDEAERLYKVILEVEPINLKANYYLGMLFQRLGRLDEAGACFKKIVELKPEFADAHLNLANILFQHNKYEEAKISYKKTILLKPDFAEAHHNLGSALQACDQFDESEKSYKRAIELKPNYAEAYNNLGTVLVQLNKYQEAEKSYKRAIELKSDYIDAYNNLGNIYYNLEKYEDAVAIYSKTIELDYKNTVAKKNLVHILNYYLPDIKNTNFIINAHNNIRKLENTFTLESGINSLDLSNLFKKSNELIKDDIGDNIDEYTYNQTQIYQTNNIDLGCNRHMRVFNKFNVIPKFCFSCFKIQIEPENVVELFKLFFIFDNLTLPKNNIRKCMVETRPYVSGTYKGLIYCSSVEETEEIIKILTPIINKITKAKIKIKRGCSEYAQSFPNYEITNKKDTNYMEYKNEWEEKENIFNKTDTKKTKVNGNTLHSLSISNILIMNIWLNYAKSIDDLTYKEISEEIFNSNYITELMSSQLETRKLEFWSTKSI